MVAHAVVHSDRTNVELGTAEEVKLAELIGFTLIDMDIGNAAAGEDEANLDIADRVTSDGNNRLQSSNLIDKGLILSNTGELINVSEVRKKFDASVKSIEKQRAAWTRPEFNVEPADLSRLVRMTHEIRANKFNVEQEFSKLPVEFKKGVVAKSEKLEAVKRYEQQRYQQYENEWREVKQMWGNSLDVLTCEKQMKELNELQRSLEKTLKWMKTELEEANETLRTTITDVSKIDNDIDKLNKLEFDQPDAENTLRLLRESRQECLLFPKIIEQRTSEIQWLKDELDTMNEQVVEISNNMSSKISNFNIHSIDQSEIIFDWCNKVSALWEARN